MELNDEMKGLLKDLGVALHQALTRDQKIKSITDQIKGSGYDIYLIMEANIALDKRDGETKGDLLPGHLNEEREVEGIRMNDRDHDILAGMNIRFNE